VRGFFGLAFEFRSRRTLCSFVFKSRSDPRARKSRSRGVGGHSVGSDRPFMSIDFTNSKDVEAVVT
jgi:hypothetical protein